MEYRTQMFDEILWLSMNSQGGISYSEAYNMPVTYRIFNIQKIVKILEQIKEEREKANLKGTSVTMSDLVDNKENIPADFKTKRAATK